MNGLHKLSKYTTQLILLFLLDYTLVFLFSLIICNSTTDEIFALCIGNFFVYEKWLYHVHLGIVNLFIDFLSNNFNFCTNGFELCNKMPLFQITQKQFSVKCLLQRKLFSFGTKPCCSKVEGV